MGQKNPNYAADETIGFHGPGQVPQLIEPGITYKVHPGERVERVEASLPGQWPATAATDGYVVDGAGGVSFADAWARVPVHMGRAVNITLGRVLSREVDGDDYNRFREMHDAGVCASNERNISELTERLRLAKWAEANLVPVGDDEPAFDTVDDFRGVFTYVDPAKEWVSYPSRTYSALLSLPAEQLCNDDLSSLLHVDPSRRYGAANDLASRRRINRAAKRRRVFYRWSVGLPGVVFSFRPIWRLVGRVNLLQVRF